MNMSHQFWFLSSACIIFLFLFFFFLLEGFLFFLSSGLCLLCTHTAVQTEFDLIHTDSTFQVKKEQKYEYFFFLLFSSILLRLVWMSRKMNKQRRQIRNRKSHFHNQEILLVESKTTFIPFLIKKKKFT